MRSGHAWRRSYANTLWRDIVGPSQDQGDWKSDQQEHDYRAEYPIWQFPRRKDSRTDLNNETRGNDVGRRHAINLSPLQLCKEAAHKQPAFATYYTGTAPVR